jgi:hypothetical protein
MENENERKVFWSKILSILREDCTQDCINSAGTKVRLKKEESSETIIILDHISYATVQELLKTGYFIDCDDEGHLVINSSNR